MKRIGVIVIAVLAASALAWQLWARRDEDSGDYRFATVERGDLESVVTATGRLEAITTVEVGTQVSGQIAEIFADFNDTVRRGQLVARIDPTLLRQEVRSAEAALARREAALDQAAWAYERAERLSAEGVLNESDFETARFNHAAARSDLEAARVGLERARRNLEYTEIRAPIDGVVVERNVELGQTVAASLSAPILFRIAEDLSRMRIVAAVDESDIGKIHDGQAARFIVQAYPDRPFSGVVRQVRLQSTTLENVVSYTVVLEVDNPDARLLPGMTATVDFLVETAQGVLVVPNAALRFLATEPMWQELRARRGIERPAAPTEDRSNGPRGPGRERRGGPPGRDPGRADRSSPQAPRPLLWFVDDDGRLDAVPVKLGITDGRSTEIEGEKVTEGMRVIAGVAADLAPEAASPFRQDRRPGDGRPGGSPPGR